MNFSGYDTSYGIELAERVLRALVDTDSDAKHTKVLMSRADIEALTKSSNNSPYNTGIVSEPPAAGTKQTRTLWGMPVVASDRARDGHPLLVPIGDM